MKPAESNFGRAGRSTGADENREIYDANWAAWREIKMHGPMSRHTRRLAFRLCKNLQFGSVLDVGCGPGVFLAALNVAFPGRELSGIDISASAVGMAQVELPSARFSVLDISQKPLPGKYDLITMIDVAEHIPNDTAAFANLLPSCEKYILISTLEGRMRPFETEVGHVRNYHKGELQQKLQNAGFRILKTVNWGWPVYSPLYRNISGSIGVHKHEISFLQRFLARLVYWCLHVTLPGKGDLVQVLACPADHE